MAMFDASGDEERMKICGCVKIKRCREWRFCVFWFESWILQSRSKMKSHQNSPLEFCADRNLQSVFFFTFDHSHLQCKLAIEDDIRNFVGATMFEFRYGIRNAFWDIMPKHRATRRQTWWNFCLSQRLSLILLMRICFQHNQSSTTMTDFWKEH